MKTNTVFAATAILAFFLNSAAVAGWEWTFPNGPDNCWTGNACADSTKNERNYAGSSTTSEAAPGVTTTAWTEPSNSNLSQRYLGSYGGGLGVINSKGDGDHEIDNQGWIDAVLLDFDSPVTLKEVTFGWVDGDSDFTLAAYTGDGNDGGTDLTQWKYDQLTTNGWEVIGSYFAAGSASQPDVASGADPVSFNVNPGSRSSSYWLVSALNPKLDSGLASFANSYKDKFKLHAAGARAPTTTTLLPAQIPEPAVKWMLLFGLLSAIGMHHYRRSRVAVESVNKKKST